VLKKTIYILFLLQSVFANAQDGHFSQYFNLPLFTNPAYAGIHQNLKVGLIYRNQYQSMPAAYSTYGIVADVYSHKLQGGLGLKIIKDDEANGIIQNQQAALSYAYQNQINKNIAFRFGMEAAFHFNQLNVSKIVVYDMLDPRTGLVYQPIQAAENYTPQSSKQFFDVNSGLIFYNNDFYTALGALHLAKPNDGFGKAHQTPLAINFQGGYIFRTKQHITSKDDWYFSPNLFLSFQDKMKETYINALAGLGHAQTAIGFRNSGKNIDAVIFYFGFSNGIFKAGYSYDLNVSSKYFYLRNGHEISIQYLFERKKKTNLANNWSGNETKSKGRRIKCPKFFR
jgi:type IX secretion system PorP/SprF family membrane protein